MGMDQYLLIPFLGEWTSIYQLFWCSPGVQGFDTLPYWITGPLSTHFHWLTAVQSKKETLELPVLSQNRMNGKFAGNLHNMYNIYIYIKNIYYIMYKHSIYIYSFACRQSFLHAFSSNQTIHLGLSGFSMVVLWNHQDVTRLYHRFRKLDEAHWCFLGGGARSFNPKSPTFVGWINHSRSL